ncbi:MAG: hypothetical protein Kow00127_04840 [Bacteroidales bacterium]
MISEAYEYFGCNSADLFVISVDYGDDNAACIQFDNTYGIEFPTISGIEGGGTEICNTYGIGAYPTYILIAPNHDIVEQDIWPVPSAQTFIDLFESHGLQQSACGSVLAANFEASATDICQFDQVVFTDMSTGVITSWEWTFEGGDPAVSTEQNPVVTYNETGVFDVTLVISDGTETSELTLEDYIQMAEAPPVMLLPFGDVCLGWPAFELTGGSPAGGVYSGPGVSNGWFDPAVAGIGTHTITYTYTGVNGCDNSATQTITVNACTGIEAVNAGKPVLRPNPAGDQVSLVIPGVNSADVTIFDAPGRILHTQKVVANGSGKLIIDLSGISDGFYFVRVHTPEFSYTLKLQIKR